MGPPLWFEMRGRRQMQSILSLRLGRARRKKKHPCYHEHWPRSFLLLSEHPGQGARDSGIVSKRNDCCKVSGCLSRRGCGSACPEARLLDTSMPIRSLGPACSVLCAASQRAVVVSLVDIPLPKSALRDGSMIFAFTLEVDKNLRSPTLRKVSLRPYPEIGRPALLGQVVTAMTEIIYCKPS